nr:MAG TPA: hypothetical protein [Caudoviricetes sp.]
MTNLLGSRKKKMLLIDMKLLCLIEHSSGA